MSETTIPFVCYYCGHETTNANDVLPRFEEGNGFECVFEDACKRRQKRDAILADMQEMAKKPYVHPVDKFSFSSIAISAGVLLGIVIVGLLFLFGF